MSCAIAVIKAAIPIIAFVINSSKLLILFLCFFFIGFPPFWLYYTAWCTICQYAIRNFYRKNPVFLQGIHYKGRNRPPGSDTPATATSKIFAFLLILKNTTLWADMDRHFSNYFTFSKYRSCCFLQLSSVYLILFPGNLSFIFIATWVQVRSSR